MRGVMQWPSRDPSRNLHGSAWTAIPASLFWRFGHTCFSRNGPLPLNKQMRGDMQWPSRDPSRNLHGSAWTGIPVCVFVSFYTPASLILFCLFESLRPVVSAEKTMIEYIYIYIYICISIYEHMDVSQMMPSVSSHRVFVFCATVHLGLCARLTTDQGHMERMALCLSTWAMACMSNGQ